MNPAAPKASSAQNDTNNTVLADTKQHLAKAYAGFKMTGRNTAAAQIAEIGKM
ncbi:hypothetical protein LTR65_004175 [Meristemomyces frigidus]